MKKLKIEFIFSLILSISFSFCSNKFETVFSQFYLNRIDFGQDQGTPLKIQIVAKTNQVFISTGFKGIALIDREANSIIFQIRIDDFYINPFDVSSDGEFLFIGLKSKIGIFKLINQDGQYQLKQLGTCQSMSEIQGIIFHEEKNLVITAGLNGNVGIFDVIDKLNGVQVGQYNTGSIQIPQISLSFDKQFIFLSCDLIGTIILTTQEKISDNTSQLIQRKVELILVAKGKGNVKALTSAATKDNSYIYQVDTWHGLFFASTQGLIYKTDQYPFELKFKLFWPFKKISPTCQSIILSQDDNFLFLGVRSQGIFILDISDKENMKFFQQIQVDQHAQAINLSPSEDYLYFSNAMSIYIFERMKVNSNDNYPNLFNVHQAKHEYMDALYKWRCYVDPSNNYMIGAFDTKGLYVFPFFGDPYRLRTTNYQFYNVQTDSLNIDPQGKYVYVPSMFSQKLITIFQAQPDDKNLDASFMNLKEVSSYNINEIRVSEAIIFSQDRQFVLITYATGMLLFDASNVLSFDLLFFWKNPDFLLGENQGGAISRDNQWVFGTIRFFGIYVLNAKDKKNLQLADSLMTLGGEAVIISEIYNEYAYLLDSVKGFAILDLTTLPKLTILSRVLIPGYCVTGILLQNENYIILSQMENGMVSLIDMSNKKNPFVLSSFRYGQEFATALCSPLSREYLFITNPEKIIVLPLISKVKIHTEVHEIKINKLTGFKKIVKYDKIQFQNNEQFKSDFVFQVGQTIQFSFGILYREFEGTNIISIYQYFQNQIIPMPYYMQYDSSRQTLVFYIDKLSLGDQRTSANLNTILLKTVIPLSSDSFIFTQIDNSDKGVTILSQSEQIYKYLKVRNLIDSQNFVTSNFDQTNDFQIDESFLKNLILPSQYTNQNEYDQVCFDIIEKIKIKLMKSSYINPIVLYVLPSLTLDENNSNKYISSISTEFLSVFLAVDKNSGRFIIKNYPGVITSTSEIQDQIKIEGNLESINKVLQDQIIFANNTNLIMGDSSDSEQKITITIVDNVNYPLIITQPINKCKLIKLKKQLKINPIKTLQSQFDKSYSDSEVYIESETPISFVQDSFIVEDANDFTYYIQVTEALNPSQDSYKNLTNDFWMQSQGITRMNYHGIIPSKFYRKIYHFKIVASDGYTQTEDYFTIKVYRIPFIYIFNLIFKVLGPVVAVLGIYRERFIFFNMFFKKRVTYSQEQVCCSQKFFKKIVILGNVNQHAKIIIENLIGKILDFDKLKHDMELKKSELNRFYYLQQKSNTDIYKEFNRQKSDLDNIDQKYIEYAENLPQNLEKIQQLILKTQVNLYQTFYEKRYLKKNGCISMSEVAKDIMKFDLYVSHRISQQSQQSYRQDLGNINSRIYRAIRGHLSRYFLKLDKRSYVVYQYILMYCKKQLLYTQNDWYKCIVNVDPIKDQEVKEDQFNNLFPNLEIKVEIFTNILIDLKLFPEKLKNQIKSFDQIITHGIKNQLGINFYMIRENLFADTLGFCSNTPSIFQPSVGESIHLPSFQIKQIIAFKKVNYHCFILPFCKLFNREYARYVVSKNMKLPSWLSLDQKHGLLIFHGAPKSVDIEDILIRIYDTTDYVIKQFILKVNPDPKNTFNVKNLSIPDEQEFQPLQLYEKSGSIITQQNIHKHFKSQTSRKIQKYVPSFIHQKSMNTSLHHIIEDNEQQQEIDLSKPSKVQRYSLMCKSNIRNSKDEDQLGLILGQKNNELEKYFLQEIDSNQLPMITNTRPSSYSGKQEEDEIVENN